jgi:DNA-binding CsgD family transcriptional regulator
MSNPMLSLEAALAVVEVAYDLDSTHEVWLRSLTSAFASAIDDKHGGFAHHFEVRADSLQLDSGVRRAAIWSEAPATLAVHPMPGSALLELCRGGPRLLTCTELQPGEGLALAGLEHAAGRDLEPLLLIASDGCGSGWLIGAAAPHGLRLSQAQRERWRRVAAQVAAAGRLRSALANASPAIGCAAQAEGLTARLRAAVVAELCSGAGAAEHEAQLETAEPGAAWSALAAGTLSLVDLFVIDGRCVVVARRNAGDSADPRALTLRERDVAERVARGRSGKEIAYELGLRTPTVSQLLHNAVRKLRVAGVAQLATVIRGLGQLQLERDRSS